MDYPTPMFTQLHAWLLHMGVVAFAGFFFVSMAWVSVTFFVVEDRGAVLGKRAISIVAGLGSVFAMWRLLASAQMGVGWLWLSLVLYAYATAMFFWAVQANLPRPLDFAFSGREPQHFNQSGPYRWVRHPFYSAYCSAWVASALATQELGVATLAATLIAIYVAAARREERIFCRSEFAADYKQYLSRVGMLVPFRRVQTRSKP